MNYSDMKKSFVKLSGAMMILGTLVLSNAQASDNIPPQDTVRTTKKTTVTKSSSHQGPGHSQSVNHKSTSTVSKDSSSHTAKPAMKSSKSTKVVKKTTKTTTDQ